MEGQMGPPASRPAPPSAAPRALASRKRVLEEDAYTQAVEAIVERDFFPAIPKLQNQLKWMEALKTGDPTVIRRAQLNIARRRAGLKTLLPGETPARGGAGTGARFTATPGTSLFTPAMTPLARPATGAATPLVGGDATAGADGAALSSSAAAAALDAAAAAGARAPKMSLDAFLSNFTGEDNASFEVLQEAANAKKRAKVAHHLEGKNQPLMLEGPAPTDEYGTSGQTPSSLTLWHFEPKNRLFYDSSQQPQLEYSAAERAAMVAGPPKRVNHAATRLGADAEAAAEAALAAAGLAATLGDGAGASARAALGGSGMDPAEALAAGAAPPSQHGAVGSRAYLRTPSLAPGAGGASPLVTWGDIAATPLRLVEGPEDEELAAMGIDPGAGEGPQFKLPEMRRREVAAREAFDKKKAAAAGSGGRRVGAGGRGGSGTPLLDSLRRTPGTPLSSAAQRLAEQLGKGRPASGAFGSGSRGGGGSTGLLTDGGLQQRLRASYGATPTPGRVGGGATPLLGRTPKVGAAAPRAVASGPPPRAPMVVPSNAGSITDDLLRLK